MSSCEDPSPREFLASVAISIAILVGMVVVIAHYGLKKKEEDARATNQMNLIIKESKLDDLRVRPELARDLAYPKIKATELVGPCVMWDERSKCFHELHRLLPNDVRLGVSKDSPQQCTIFLIHSSSGVAGHYSVSGSAGVSVTTTVRVYYWPEGQLRHGIQITKSPPARRRVGDQEGTPSPDDEIMAWFKTLHRRSR